jgi:hypothetical protein
MNNRGRWMWDGGRRKERRKGNERKRDKENEGKGRKGVMLLVECHLLKLSKGERDREFTMEREKVIGSLIFSSIRIRSGKHQIL